MSIRLFIFTPIPKIKTFVTCYPLTSDPKLFVTFITWPNTVESLGPVMIGSSQYEILPRVGLDAQKSCDTITWEVGPVRMRGASSGAYAWIGIGIGSGAIVSAHVRELSVVGKYSLAHTHSIVGISDDRGRKNCCPDRRPFATYFKPKKFAFWLRSFTRLFLDIPQYLCYHGTAVASMAAELRPCG